MESTTIKALDKLKAIEDKGLVNELVKSKKKFGIEETYKYDRFYIAEKLVEWDTKAMVEAQGEDFTIAKLSPAVGLYHELGHAGYKFLKKHFRNEIRNAYKEYKTLEADEQSDYGGLKNIL